MGSTLNTITKRTEWRLLSVIFLIGLGLRFYQLGHDLFWFDEVGVVIAARQNSLSETLRVSQLYIMSMPLDYITARLVALISQTEGAMRLPSALWGTLSILSAYLLFRELVTKQLALLGTFLLAIMPIHIKYSQEARFYAPLVFFYVLSSYAGLVAIKKRSILFWIVFSVITMIGILFHIYCVFVLINVGLWALIMTDTAKPKSAVIRQYLFSTCLLLIFTVVALLFFGKLPNYKSNLFEFESPAQVFLGGLGWFPPFPAINMGFLFGSLCMFGTILGLFSLLRNPKVKHLFVIPISMFLQIVLIVLGDIIEGYFASGRQFLIVIPFVTLLTAVGIEKTIRYFGNGNLKSVGIILAVCTYSFAAIPVLSQYYKSQKVDVYNITNWLYAHWHDGEKIYYSPQYEILLYKFYLEKWSQESHDERLSKINGSMVSFDVASPTKAVANADYLITDFTNNDQVKILKATGFSQEYVSPYNTIRRQIIWGKNGK